MSKIDFQENDQYIDNFENEESFFPNESYTNPYSVPKLVSDLQQVIKDLLSKSSQLKQLTSALKQNTSFQVPEFLEPFVIENQLISTITKSKNLSHMHIGAVDGGLVTSNLAGVDILGLKAVGVYLHYGHNKILKTNYFPTKHQDVKLVPVYKIFSRPDLDIYSSLQRSILELKTGITLLEEAPASLDYMLMDGSFQFKRIITPNPELNVLFGKYFAYLRKLLAKAQSQNTQLLFVVKDSITSHFITILSQLLPHVITAFPDLHTVDYRTIIQDLRDSNFMHYLLSPRSRSFIINRTFASKEPIELNYVPYSYYFKVIKNDLPLRIDLLTRPKQSVDDIISTVDESSKVLLALSEFNKNYSLPAPIIEADARTKINQEQFELLLDYIRHKTFNFNSIESQKLRRTRSPFRF